MHLENTLWSLGRPDNVPVSPSIASQSCAVALRVSFTFRCQVGKQLIVTPELFLRPHGRLLETCSKRKDSVLYLDECGKQSSIRVERLNAGRPILQNIPAHPWENAVTFNPACTLITDTDELRGIVSNLTFDSRTKATLLSQPALCFLLYRAQGKRTVTYDYSRSSIGLAILDPDLHLLARHSGPVILPDQSYDNLGVEDPRITKVNHRYSCSTAYSRGEPKNRIRIGLASTTDFIHWTKHGLLKGDFNTIDNKNAMLFEKKNNGKYLMLHRPMEGLDAMAIHWAEADDIFGEWTTRGALMKPHPNPAFTNTWIGGGAPPMQLPDGRQFILYHVGNRKADMTREYDLGVALADFSTKEIIVKRDEPFMRPETPAEISGDADLGVANVLFVCGAYFHKGAVYFPYAGADSVVLGGRISKAELEMYVRK